jgi:hypothetical protein
MREQAISTPWDKSTGENLIETRENGRSQEICAADWGGSCLAWNWGDMYNG